MWVADEDQGVSSPVLPVFSREPDVPMCTERGKEGLGGVQPIYGEPERQAWMKDAEWPALRVTQLKVTQRSCHSPLSTRQSGAGWEHRKQQMVGTRAAGMAFLVISPAHYVSQNLVSGSSQRLEGRQLRVTGMLHSKARQRGSACCSLLPASVQSCVLELCQSRVPMVILWNPEACPRPPLA